MKSLHDENWSFEEGVDFLFDVDGIIAQAVSENQVEVLYDRVIQCLRDLLNSGEVDSVRASDDLRRLVTTLERSRSASFSSKVLSWQFARRLIPNILSAYAKKNAVAGPLIEAFEQTATELNVSLEKTKDQIGTKILLAANGALRTDTAKSISSDVIFLLEDRSEKITGAE